MRIAVVGTGISGNLAAALLGSRHAIDVYESASHVGGHAHSVDIECYGRRMAVDAAFMVFNERTYPNFCQLLDLLGVPAKDSDMSFSVRCHSTGLEYQGSSLNGLFAQRRNLLKPSFYRMLLDVMKFNRAATAYVQSADEKLLLGEFVDRLALGREFREQYLIPMSAAIWSADPSCLPDFPARFILGFFRNHGLLQLRDRPRWKTIAGGSRNYVNALTRPFRNAIATNCPVTGIRRHADRVELEFGDESKSYDQVVLATHADQSLSLLRDASQLERRILSCFPYQRNEAVLHFDSSVMPSRPAAWASWNYHITAARSRQVSVTYDLNRLQRLGAPGPVCVTLNPTFPIAPEKILSRFEYQHPVFSRDSVHAQQSFTEISGQRRTHFCGAYWGFGFHEDGVNSALAVAKHFGLQLADLSSVAGPLSTPTARHAVSAELSAAQ